MKRKILFSSVLLFVVLLIFFFILLYNNKLTDIPKPTHSTQNMSNTKSNEYEESKEEFISRPAFVVTSLTKDELINFGIDFWTSGSLLDEENEFFLNEDGNLSKHRHLFSRDVPTFIYWISLKKDQFDFLSNNNNVFVILPDEPSNLITQ